MDFRVTISMRTPPISSIGALAEQLDDATDRLLKVAPTAAPVVDASIGEPVVHFTMTVNAQSVQTAVSTATDLIAQAFLPILEARAEPAEEERRIAL